MHPACQLSGQNHGQDEPLICHGNPVPSCFCKTLFRTNALNRSLHCSLPLLPKEQLESHLLAHNSAGVRKDQSCSDVPSVLCVSSTRPHTPSLADLGMLGKRMYSNRWRPCCTFSTRMACTLCYGPGLHTSQPHSTARLL